MSHSGPGMDIWHIEKQWNIIELLLGLLKQNTPSLSSADSKSIAAVFPTASPQFMSLCYSLVICNISNFFIIIIFVMIICDQWPLMLPLQFVLRCHEPHQYRTANNSANACLPIAPIPFFLPLLESPQFLRHKDIESKSVSNPVLTSKGPSERNNHRSLTLSHKLEWSNSVREACRKSRLANN